MTDGIATRRSDTLTPVAASPDIIARLIMRAAGWASRLVTTRAPRASVVPYAIASRAATSDVMSTLTSPLTSSRPNRVVMPRDSQIRLEWMVAPASIVLNGYTLTPGASTACAPTEHSSPIATPSLSTAWARTSTPLPRMAPSSRALWPRYAPESTMLREICTPSLTTAFCPSTV